jgi:hypothetical protein
MRRLICWLFGHTDPVLFGVDEELGKETYLCRDCLESWSEYNVTGRHTRAEEGKL